MGHKAAETTHNINKAFGPETANECTVQRWFKNVQEMRALKMRSIVASHWKLTMTNWEDHQSWSFYNYMTNWWRTQCRPFYGHLAFEARQVDTLWTDQKSKNTIISKCHLLLLYTATMNHFSIGLWHATKSGFYWDNSNDQLSDWTKKKLQSISKSQTCAKKVHGHWLSAAG